MAFGFAGRCISAGVLILWSTAVFGRDYYVAKTGSDTNPGTIDQPFLTIQRAASVMVAGRHGVHSSRRLPRNGASGELRSSGRTHHLSALQQRNRHGLRRRRRLLRIRGALSSGNIYKAPLSWDLGEGANQVFLDGQMMIEARWPNTTLDVSRPIVALTGGGSYVDGAAGFSTGTITGLDLPSRPAGYWNGATIHISPFNVTYNQGAGWSWQTGTVVNATASQLSFTWSRWVTVEVPNPLVPGPRNPYYLSGKLGELDAAAEWFLDSATFHALSLDSGGRQPGATSGGSQAPPVRLQPQYTLLHHHPGTRYFRGDHYHGFAEPVFGAGRIEGPVRIALLPDSDERPRTP